MRNYQGKRPDQIETSKRESAYAFIALALFLIIWSLIS